MRFSQLDSNLPEVSRLSLGSWNTFSRISFEECVALIRRALDLGVNLFDLGYYWDKPHTEVIFGRAMQVVGPKRSDYLIAEKLWLWDYPEQSFLEQLEGSLLRSGYDEVDLLMVSRPTEGFSAIEIAEQVVELLDAGLARAWGVTNWEPEQVRAVQAHFAAKGKKPPCLVQMQYNVCRRGVVENEGYSELFSRGDVKLCAAHVLEGGILGGHLNRDRVNPSEFSKGVVPQERNIARDSGGVRSAIRDLQPAFANVAQSFGLSPAQAAIAFTQQHHALATTLVGVTRVEDLEANVEALNFTEGSALLEAIAPFEIEGVAHPLLFSPTNENA